MWMPDRPLPSWATKEGETYCDFSIMVNGGRINPETIIELKSHKLRRQTVQFRKHGSRINRSR